MISIGAASVLGGLHDNQLHLIFNFSSFCSSRQLKLRIASTCCVSQTYQAPGIEKAVYTLRLRPWARFALASQRPPFTQSRRMYQRFDDHKSTLSWWRGECRSCVQPSDMHAFLFPRPLLGRKASINAVSGLMTGILMVMQAF